MGILQVVFNIEAGYYYSKPTFIMTFYCRTRETCVHIGYFIYSGVFAVHVGVGQNYINCLLSIYVVVQNCLWTPGYPKIFNYLNDSPLDFSV